MMKHILSLYYEYGISFIEQEEWKKIQEFLKNQAKNKQTKSISQIKPALVSLKRDMRKEPKIDGDRGVESSDSSSLFHIKTLEDLKRALASFEGVDLKKMARNTVFSDGNPKSSLLLVGEAPGVDEDIQGIPFVGQSGQLLNKMLLSIGIDRTQCYIINIVPWRPPGNRAPTTQEIALCLPFTRRHIELIRPKVILLLGSVATKALLNKNEGISKLRGTIQLYQGEGTSIPPITPIPAVPTFHPAYLMRSPSHKAKSYRDFLIVSRLLRA